MVVEREYVENTFEDLEICDVFVNGLKDEYQTVFMKIEPVHIIGKGKVNAICLANGKFVNFEKDKAIHKFSEVKLVVKD